MGTKRLNAREASLAALLRVEEEGAFASLALAEVLPCVQDHRDRKLAAEITYGVITYKSTLDWLIEHTAGRPVDKLDRPVLDILRIGFYQLFFLDRIPPQAAVHATVELVKQGKKRALAPFVNGVLRGALRNKNKFPWPDREKDEVAYLALKYAHPPWLVRRWLSRLGPETELLLAANNRPAPFTVRVNSLKTSRKLLQAALTEQGLQPEPSSITAEGLVLKEPGRFTSKEAWKAGLFQVQGESAMLVSHVVDPRPGERVLDGCSAPGGKTTHLAELMKNSGEITALDIHPRRLALVEAACRRLGITIVNTVCLDMREASPGNCGMFDRASGRALLGPWRNSPQAGPEVALPGRRYTRAGCRAAGHA